MPRERRWATTFDAVGVTEDPPLWTPLIPPEDLVPGITVVRTIGSIIVNSENTNQALSQHLVLGGVFVGPTPDGSEVNPLNIDSTDWLWFSWDTLFDVSIGGATTQATSPTSTWRTISSRGARRLGPGENVWGIWGPFGAPATDWLGGIFAFRTLYLLPG